MNNQMYMGQSINPVENNNNKKSIDIRYIIIAVLALIIVVGSIILFVKKLNKNTYVDVGETFTVKGYNLNYDLYTDGVFTDVVINGIQYTKVKFRVKNNLPNETTFLFTSFETLNEKKDRIAISSQLNSETVVLLDEKEKQTVLPSTLPANGEVEGYIYFEKGNEDVKYILVSELADITKTRKKDNVSKGYETWNKYYIRF